MNLLARAQTDSSHKHHNTVKYLIGITPQGTVSFISDGWGGRVSDKYLTENCGLLDYLIPGDTVLADRALIFKTLLGSAVHMWPFHRLLKEKSSLQALMLRRPGVLLMYVFMLSVLLDSFTRSILYYLSTSLNLGMMVYH